MPPPSKSSHPGDTWADQEAAFFGDGGGSGGGGGGERRGGGAPSAARAAAKRAAGESAPRRRWPFHDSPTEGRSSRREPSRRLPPPGTGRPGTGLRGGGISAAAPTVNAPAPARPPSGASSGRDWPSAVSLLPGLTHLTSQLGSHLSSQIDGHLRARVPHCVVCGALNPSPYKYQPFFPEEIACSSHADVAQCCSCRRYEPLARGNAGRFSDLEDHGRRLCGSCLRTVVTDSEEGAALWFWVLRYFRRDLGLFDGGVGSGGSGMLGRMERVPVLIVGHDALNDPSVRGSGHGSHDRAEDDVSNASHTRGLCLYEYTHHPLGGQLRDFLRGVRCNDTVSAVLDALGGDGLAAATASSGAHVTAVLCLRGLPRDLAASVLAHEATHAWFKLHPRYDPSAHIPRMVEEGCCQLLAFLYLRHLDDEEGGGEEGVAADHLDEDGPSDHKLRQYFRYCIETMTDDVYGEGFRRAAAAYAEIGSVGALLEFVVTNGDFPQ